MEPGKSSECKIFTSQQTTFVWRLVLLIWRSKHGWFDEMEACTKNFGAVGTMALTPLSLKTWGGAGGCRIQGPPPPPRVGTGATTNPAIVPPGGWWAHHHREKQTLAIRRKFKGQCNQTHIGVR